jgi:hypothetical protein
VGGAGHRALPRVFQLELPVALLAALLDERGDLIGQPRNRILADADRRREGLGGDPGIKRRIRDAEELEQRAASNDDCWAACEGLKTFPAGVTCSPPRDCFLRSASLSSAAFWDARCCAVTVISCIDQADHSVHELKKEPRDRWSQSMAHHFLRHRSIQLMAQQARHRSVT